MARRTFTFTITACIDDHSTLFLWKDLVQWSNSSGARPGTHPGCASSQATAIHIEIQELGGEDQGPISEPPQIVDISWTPQWDGRKAPDGQDGSIPFQLKDNAGRPVRLPTPDDDADDGEITYGGFTQLRGRTPVAAPTFPTARPDHLLIVDFTDGWSGPDVYSVQFTVTCAEVGQTIGRATAANTP